MHAHAPSLDADVVVVGAGPVGMTAALLLARRDLSVVVLERQSSPSSEPKAISLDDESLRTYQSAGIDERIMSIVVPGTGTVYYAADGYPLFHAKGPAPYRLGHPFKNPFAQPDLELVLRDLIAEHPAIKLQYGRTVVDLREHDDLISAVVAETVQVGDDDVRLLTDEDRAAIPTRTVSARYLIGADGGRSTVRERLGVDMTGRSHDECWLVIDTLDDEHDERFGMHHGDPRRPHVIVPGLHGRCRYELRLNPGEGAAGERPDFELMRRLVAPYRELRPEQIERAVIYRFNALNANHWQIGRAFLAGDAAHMMPPFAGQGLNSGIRDVANLSWKIAGVLAGRLDEKALASYQTERRPHADATIRLSERLGRIVMTTSPRLAQRRDRRVREALTAPDGRRFFEEMRYRPAVRAEAGLVHDIAGDDAVGTALGQPRVFDSEQHRPRMLDDVIGPGWALIGVGVASDEWQTVAELRELTDARALHVPTGDHLPTISPNTTVLVDLDGGLNREFASHAGCFLLVRPDRLIAAKWPPANSPATARGVSRWFRGASHINQRINDEA